MTVLLIVLCVFIYFFMGGVISKVFDCTEMPICLYCYAFWPLMLIGADFTEFVQNKIRKENKK